MTFDEYQKQALVTAHDTTSTLGKTITAMGIAGEAGEVLEKWKKILVYQGGKVSDTDILEIKKELGDVVWYVAVLAHSLGLSFEEVIKLNTEKLKDRQKRNVIKGAGDNR